MPSPRRQVSHGRAAYVVVDHKDMKREAQAGSIEAKDAVVIVDENTEHGNARRTLKNFSVGQKDDDDNSDDSDNDDGHLAAQVPAKAAPSTPSPSAAVSMVRRSQHLININ